MACARHLGLTNIPIVCVNVDGYYDTFMSILQRAHDDQLLYKKPRDIVHFEDTAEAAVLWIEAHLEEFKNLTQQKQPIKKRSSILRKMDSNVSGSTFSVWGRMSSFFGDGQKATSEEKKFDKMIIFSNILVFTAGLSLGLLATRRTG